MENVKLFLSQKFQFKTVEKIKNKNRTRASLFQSSEDGKQEKILCGPSIARYNTQCSQGIDWKKSKLVVTERNTNQRKVREGVESEINSGEKHPSTVTITQTIGIR